MIYRKTVGVKNVNKKNKTILLVGETGAGKSTLINALVNYTTGVKFDDVWFEIVEDEKRGQSESQTSDVMVYQIFGFEDETLPFSLTIIDTPGYGDTRGIKQDVNISQRLLDLFRSVDGVHELDAVGLVMKASMNRLSDQQKYIFDSVTSLLGNDIEKNIVVLITHSTGRTPKNVLQALEAANIKCAKNEKNQPVHFLFDNCQDEDRTDTAEYLKHSGEITMKGMDQFIVFLEKTAPQKLSKTVDVLNKRIRLTACIQNLKELTNTRKDVKEKHEKDETENERKGNIVENLQTEMEVLGAEETKLLDEVYQHVVTLEQIALNVNSLSTHVHLDFLIEKMKERGDTEKVQKLEEIKSQMGEGTMSDTLRHMFTKLTAVKMQ